MQSPKSFNAIVLAVIAAMAGASCSDFAASDDSSGSGGTDSNTGAGGQSGVSGGAPGAGGSEMVSFECTGENVAACGGELTGTWNVAESCMVLSGDMDVSITSLGCPTVPVTGSLEVSGSFVAASDGSLMDNTVTTGAVSFPLDPSCLTVSSVDVACGDLGSIFEAMGWSTAVCSETAGQCGCELTVEQQGGLGAVLPYTETNTYYTVTGTAFTAGPGTYNYCSVGDTMTLTPRMSGLVGQVIIVRDGAAVGTGGAPGTGGAAAVGGAPAAGGAEDGAGGSETGAGGVDGSGGDTGAGGADGTGGAVSVPDKPCDIYEDAGTPCVAAHSTVRALFAAFDGALYQVKRSDGQMQDIPTLSPGGYADSSVQDAFCDGSGCTMWRLYDQSGHGNFLEAQTPESTVGGNAGMTAANATAEDLMVDGHKVYSLFTRPNQAYWNNGSMNGMPLGAEPQGIYMVTSGTHYNGACCYNYGNGQLDRLYSGGPMMDSIYFGDSTQWGNGAGAGPWVMADMEDGMLAGGFGDNDQNFSLAFPFVTAMEKNDGTTTFALKGGDATQPTLTTMWDGALPGSKSPMEKQGAVLLGAGGDCCLHNNNLSEGTFYEGAIVAGYPSNETDQAIHQNIFEARYGQ